jgi:gluconate 2-dehydrogenase gamma chain
MPKDTPNARLSRRGFLNGMLLGATALSGVPGKLFAREIRGGESWPWVAGAADVPYYGREDARFLTPEERAFVDAASARLIPSDEDGPGAREADVLTFIDRQLAGHFGNGQRWYMHGPWPERLPTQGYQTHHTPAQLYRASIAAINDWCRANMGDRRFDELTEDEQDDVLTAVEDEEITAEDVPLGQFFELFHENVIEGFFADPIYGGNRDMVGWHYVGFPGARYDYRDYVHHNGAAIDLPPVSLAGRPGWIAER